MCTIADSTSKEDGQAHKFVSHGAREQAAASGTIAINQDGHIVGPSLPR
jgi:hypothetical protein